MTNVIHGKRAPSRNRSVTLAVDVEGKRTTLVDLSRQSGVSYSTLYNRLRRGALGLQVLR